MLVLHGRRPGFRRHGGTGGRPVPHRVVHPPTNDTPAADSGFYETRPSPRRRSRPAGYRAPHPRFDPGVSMPGPLMRGDAGRARHNPDGVDAPRRPLRARVGVLEPTPG